MQGLNAYQIRDKKARIADASSLAYCLKGLRKFSEYQKDSDDKK